LLGDVGSKKPDVRFWTMSALEARLMERYELC
jgi:hypothetical protein